jgi:hypothetical protein
MMKKKIGFTAVLIAALGGVADAKVLWLKKAQEIDPNIKSCLACHETMKVTPEDKKLNARGQFLQDKKKELKVDEVDLKWLKDYKEKKK